MLYYTMCIHIYSECFLGNCRLNRLSWNRYCMPSSVFTYVYTRMYLCSSPIHMSDIAASLCIHLVNENNVLRWCRQTAGRRRRPGDYRNFCHMYTDNQHKVYLNSRRSCAVRLMYIQYTNTGNACTRKRRAFDVPILEAALPNPRIWLYESDEKHEHTRSHLYQTQ